MKSQQTWIGIVITAFFVGLGGTYLIFHTGSSDVNEDFNMIEQSSMMSNMQFNTNAPLTIPMIDGYYNREKIYFIHTEISDKDIADMMSMMINFPTLHVPDLDNISSDELGKVYIFTNGIEGSGPYGGGPFFFQIDIFDSVPGMDEYNQFRVPQLVTWNEDSNPILLTSIDELFEAEANDELSIESTGFVVNAPIIVWTSDGKTQTASMIQNMFESMSGVVGELTFVDKDNYIALFKLHSKKDMGMMGMNP
ncbi:MAG: hypothetical protein IIB02_05785 [Thaumarchaeota archaeon]|nr:hypothetical protein [Nitrososphaerota archaeon]